jgi:lipoprotein signal peptidase
MHNYPYLIPSGLPLNEGILLINLLNRFGKLLNVGIAFGMLPTNGKYILCILNLKIILLVTSANLFSSLLRLNLGKQQSR